MNSKNPLDSVYFIKMPEEFKLSVHDIHLDPQIMLPVQKKETDAPGNFNMQELSQVFSFSSSSFLSIRA